MPATRKDKPVVASQQYIVGSSRSTPDQTVATRGHRDVVIEQEEREDSETAAFLEFLAKDIDKNPTRPQPLSTEWLRRARALVANVKIDLDAPLSADDE